MAMFINEKTCYLIFLLTCFSFIYAMILLCLTATGALRCEINNGGCWKKTHDGVTYSACAVCCWTLNQLVIHIFYLALSYCLWSNWISDDWAGWLKRLQVSARIQGWRNQQLWWYCYPWSLQLIESDIISIIKWMKWAY